MPNNSFTKYSPKIIYKLVTQYVSSWWNYEILSTRKLSDVFRLIKIMVNIRIKYLFLCHKMQFQTFFPLLKVCACVPNRF